MDWFSVPMQHSQTERFKNAQSIRISQKKIHGCPGAFTYITAQIVKERSVSLLKRQNAADGLHPLISGLGDGGASRDRTGDP